MALNDTLYSSHGDGKSESHPERDYPVLAPDSPRLPTRFDSFSFRPAAGPRMRVAGQGHGRIQRCLRGGGSGYHTSPPPLHLRRTHKKRSATGHTNISEPYSGALSGAECPATRGAGRCPLGRTIRAPSRTRVHRRPPARHCRHPLAQRFQFLRRPLARQFQLCCRRRALCCRPVPGRSAAGLPRRRSVRGPNGAVRCGRGTGPVCRVGAGPVCRPAPADLPAVAPSARAAALASVESDAAAPTGLAAAVPAGRSGEDVPVLRLIAPLLLTPLPSPPSRPTVGRLWRSDTSAAASALPRSSTGAVLSAAADRSWSRPQPASADVDFIGDGSGPRCNSATDPLRP